LTDVQSLRRQSLWLSRLTLVLLLATIAVIVVPPVAADLHSGLAAPLLWGIALQWLPSLFYLYALWALRSGFQEFAAGGVLGPAIAAGCTRAGVALAIGAGFSAVGVPNLARILSGRGLIDTTDATFTGFLVFDTAYLAVGVIGLALLLLGRLLRRASEVQAEAAALRDELDAFF